MASRGEDGRGGGRGCGGYRDLEDASESVEVVAGEVGEANVEGGELGWREVEGRGEGIED